MSTETFPPDLHATEPLTPTEMRNLDAVTNVLPHWNAHDIDAALESYAPEITWTNLAMEEVYQGHAGVAGFLASLYSGFPDMTFAVSKRFARGEEIAEEWIMSGTHGGKYLGIPPTGRRVEIRGASLIKMRDGKFISDDFYYDGASVMRQLGVLPSMAFVKSPAGRLGLRVASRLRRIVMAPAGLLGGRGSQRRAGS
jgi:steroid delta-isomerase-like uncharacterized protein